MTAIADKLKAAGADTLGAELTTLCVEALRLYPNNVGRAWEHVGEVFGQGFLLSLMNDMQPPRAARAAPSRPNAATLMPAASLVEAPAYKPRVIPPERLERRRELQRIVSKYKNSSNVAWSDVGWHELTGMQRDGKEASALLQEGPANVPNDGRNIGAVLGIKRVDEIIAGIRNRA